MTATDRISRILETLPARDRWCVEFGAWDGKHLSNTRELIDQHGYRAVLIEADPRRYRSLGENYARNARVTTLNVRVGFGTADNLDRLLEALPVPHDFDFLSINIDGNDFHVWKAMQRLRPKVVCIEFNHTIPNAVHFVQPADPVVNQGCSLRALVELAATKGYELIEVDACNAFFVTRELFDRYGVEDNRPEKLRANDAVTYLFSGYDGTIFLRGERRLPWHGIELDEAKMQQLPKLLRKYPDARSELDVWLYRVYRLLVHPRAFIGQFRGWIRRALGEQATGVVDLVVSPRSERSLDAAFNAQRARQALFRELVRAVPFAAIVETGTFRGTTTLFMHRVSGLRVHSVELDPRHYRFAWTRFALTPGIEVTRGDSRRFLDALGRDSRLPAGAVFFYLDAHWNADLPLWDEVDRILGRWPRAVVMIDDFAVPNDPGYRHDDYGPGRALTVDWLRGACARAAEARIFFPSVDSASESGGRRGCVVLATDATLGRTLAGLDGLREHRP